MCYNLRNVWEKKHRQSVRLNGKFPEASTNFATKITADIDLFRWFFEKRIERERDSNFNSEYIEFVTLFVEMEWIELNFKLHEIQSIWEGWLVLFSYRHYCLHAHMKCELHMRAARMECLDKHLFYNAMNLMIFKYWKLFFFNFYVLFTRSS